MTYLSALQVKNLLVKKGITRGAKASGSKKAIGGVATTDLGDGWVWVQYSNSAQAEKEGVNPTAYDFGMKEIIHFILKDMNNFEYRHEVRETTTQPLYDHFYRKAI